MELSSLGVDKSDYSSSSNEAGFSLDLRALLELVSTKPLLLRFLFLGIIGSLYRRRGTLGLTSLKVARNDRSLFF
jgi:hypothetical protein